MDTKMDPSEEEFRKRTQPETGLHCAWCGKPIGSGRFCTGSHHGLFVARYGRQADGSTRGRNAVRLLVTVAGEEHMPQTGEERTKLLQLWESNAGKINELFRNYFGLHLKDRYMGNFPYPDRETGRPCTRWALAMGSRYTRDAIVACLRAAIVEAGLADVVVRKKDKDPEDPPRNSPWPADLDIIAMGDSITDVLVGEQRIEAALNALEAWLSRV